MTTDNDVPQSPVEPIERIDADVLMAQIDANSASQDSLFSFVDDYIQNNKTIPPKIEAEVLKIHLVNHPDRIDLKRRLAAVNSMLGRETDADLLKEVRDSMIADEHQTDFQSLLEEFSRQTKYADLEPEFIISMNKVRKFTMTTTERLHALWSSVNYVARARIPGDIVECGVWRGGSMMLAALELLRTASHDRRLWLYDTFAGLPKPDAEVDVDVLGNRAIDGWNAHTLTDGKTYWAYADRADVTANMLSTGYPEGLLTFVEGMVEETIPATAPGAISLLRIDTDWYASYRHVLNALYDRVSPGGIVIFDDYGHFGGARKAVDEFLAEHSIVSPLIRVDYSCRMMIKPGTVQQMPRLGTLERIMQRLRSYRAVSAARS